MTSTTETTRVFLLELVDQEGDVKLKRPSTSRHTILGAVHYLLEAVNKNDWDFTLTISRAELPKDEIKAMITAFDEAVHGEMAAAELAGVLKAGATDAAISDAESDFEDDLDETDDHS